jgi:hypothetical protein
MVARANYVTWVGIDGYYVVFRCREGSRTIGQVRAITRKPIPLSETGVGQVQAGLSRSAICWTGSAAGALGLVWFRESAGRTLLSELAHRSDRLAEVAFRLGRFAYPHPPLMERRARRYAYSPYREDDKVLFRLNR